MSTEPHEFELDELYKIALKLKEFATDKKRIKHDYVPDKSFIDVTLDYVQKLKKYIWREGRPAKKPVELETQKHTQRPADGVADNPNFRYIKSHVNKFEHPIIFPNASVTTTDWTPTADFFLQEGCEPKNMDDDCEPKSECDPNLSREAGDKSLYLDILENQLRDARLAALIKPPENPFCGNKDPREFERWLNKLEIKMNQLGGDPWD